MSTPCTPTRSTLRQHVTLLFVTAMIVAFTFLGNPVQAQASTNIGRINGNTLIETAVATSKHMYPNTAETVILLNQGAADDSISIGTLANIMDAAILLTSDDGLPEVTFAEIERLKPRQIYISGGTKVVPEDIAQFLRDKKYTVARISGPDRYATSEALFKEVQSRVEIRKVGLVASGSDAMGTASYRKQDFPILLVNPEAPSDFVKELKVPKVIFGSTKSFSDKLAKDLGVSQRIVGQYDIDTAVQVSSLSTAHTAVIVNVNNIVETLLAARYASFSGSTIIMTDGQSLTPTATQYLQAARIRNLTVIGGEAAIPSALLALVSPHINDITDSRPMVALTFDDGPNPSTTLRVLKALQNANAHGTFFMLGQQVKKYPDVVRQVADAGMEIGNHSWSHPQLTKLTEPKLREQIDHTDQVISEATGASTTLLRPPYGATNATVKAIVNKPEIMWSIDTLDWKSRNTEKVIDKVVGKVRDGDIILFHDIYETSAAAIEYLIPKLTEEGFQLVTVTDLFKARNMPLDPHGVVHNARPKTK